MSTLLHLKKQVNSESSRLPLKWETKQLVHSGRSVKNQSSK